MVYRKTLNLNRKFKFIGNLNHSIPCDNSKTAFSMTEILCQNSWYGWETVFFLPKGLEKLTLFLNFGWSIYVTLLHVILNLQDQIDCILKLISQELKIKSLDKLFKLIGIWPSSSVRYLLIYEWKKNVSDSICFSF